MVTSWLCIVAMVVVVCSGTGSVVAEEAVVRAPYPEPPALPLSSQSFFCRALVGTLIIAEPTELGGLPHDVEARAFSGTDEISIRVKGDSLYFLTSTSFKASDERASFTVLQNDADLLVAVQVSRVSGIMINSIAVNRKTGIGVWTKSRSRGFLKDNPDAQAYCLKCESR